MQLPFTSSLVTRLAAGHADTRQLLRDLEHELDGSLVRSQTSANRQTADDYRNDDLDYKSSESSSDEQTAIEKRTDSESSSSSSSSSSSEEEMRSAADSREADTDSAAEDVGEPESQLQSETRHEREKRLRKGRDSDESDLPETDGRGLTVSDRWLRQLLRGVDTRKGTGRTNVRREEDAADASESDNDDSSDDSSSSEEGPSAEEHSEADSRSRAIKSRETYLSLPDERSLGSARFNDRNAAEGGASNSDSSSSEEEERANAQPAVYILSDTRARDKRQKAPATRAHAEAEDSSSSEEEDTSSSSEEEDTSSSEEEDSSSSEERAEVTARKRLRAEPHLAAQLASLDRLARALVH